MSKNKIRRSVKDRKLLMFKNEGKRKRLSFFSGWLGFFFKIALIVTIVTAVLFIICMALEVALWLVLVLITFGLILINGVPSLAPFANSLIPVIITSLIITVALFVLKFIIEWLYVLSESRSLKKHPKENAHYIAVARTVKIVKIVDIIVFLAMMLSIVLMIIVANATGISEEANSGGAVMGWIALIIFIVFPIIGKRIARQQFAKVDGDIQAILGNNP